jgi:hypothetical protein
MEEENIKEIRVWHRHPYDNHHHHNNEDDDHSIEFHDSTSGGIMDVNHDIFYDVDAQAVLPEKK